MGNTSKIEKKKIIKKGFKKNSAITLIALVITIIVLLILAGVTIATLTGDNGLLQKATNAKEENEKAKELELIKLAVLAAQARGECKLNTTYLKNELEKNLNDNDIDSNLKPISDYWNYKGYKIDKDGNVEKLLLPKEYQQVEYIESSGGQYIDTNLKPTENMNMSIEFKFNELTGNKNSLWGTTVKSKQTSIFISNNKHFYIRFGEGTFTDETTNIYERKLVTSKDKKGYYNNKTVTYGNGWNNDTLYLFAEKEDGNMIFGKGKIYSYRFGYDNQISIDLIPCYRISDNKPGMYDLIEEEFYTNKGTGDDFIVGQEV